MPRSASRSPKLAQRRSPDRLFVLTTSRAVEFIQSRSSLGFLRLFRSHQLEKHERAARDQIFFLKSKFCLLRLRLGGVDEPVPGGAALRLRQREFDRLVVGVEQKQYGDIVPALANPCCLRASVKQHAKGARLGVAPLFLREFSASRRQPCHVLDLQLVVERAGQESIPPQDRQVLAQ